MAVTACVSIPVHEAPAVVLDQVANVRAFLPRALIVLHVSPSFMRPEQLAPLLPEGVFVNDAPVTTEWGDTAPAHNANFRFMDARERFDVFVMHASNDLYVMSGAEDRLGEADAGVQVHPIHADYGLRPELRDIALAAQHPGLLALGGGTVYHSQPEGIFFARGLFREMLRRMEAELGTGAHYYRGPDDYWGSEHYCYPTAAIGLADRVVAPVLYSEVQGTGSRRPITAATIWGIRERRFREGEWCDVNDPDDQFGVPGRDFGPPFRRYDFDHVYAVKRIPREYDHPLRGLVRTIARAERGPLALPRQTEGAGLLVVAFAEEIVADPALLGAAAGALSNADPVTIAIAVTPEMVGHLTSAVQRLGLDGEEAVRMEALIVDGSELGLCTLRAGADLLLSAREPAPLFADLVRIEHSNARELALLVRRRAPVSSAVARG